MSNPPKKNLTLKKFAEICKLSVGTVSAVINNKGNVKEETAALVKLKMNEYGYRPNPWAQRMQRSRSGMLAILMPLEATLYHQYLCQKYCQYCHDQHLIPMVFYVDEDESLNLNNIPMDGVILMGNFLKVEQILREQNVPYVFFDRPFLFRSKGRDVWVDRLSGGKSAAQKMISNGLHELWFIGSNSDHDEKWLGFRQEAESQGVQLSTLSQLTRENLSLVHAQECGIFIGGLKSAMEVCFLFERENLLQDVRHKVIYWGGPCMDFSVLNNMDSIGEIDESGFDQLMKGLNCGENFEGFGIQPIFGGG